MSEDDSIPVANVSYEYETDSYICWDNNPGTAEHVKQLYPDATVFLHDRKTGHRTRYTISYIHRKPHMKNGKLIYKEETLEL